METIIIKSPKYGEKIVKIDESEYNKLIKHKWYLEKSNNNFYAYTTIKINSVKKNFKMHRLIMGLNFGDGLIVDHINHNGLDNTKENLRLATKSQNGQNSKSQKNSSSKYLGVSYYKRDNLWTAQIKVENKKLHLGRFLSEQKAAECYNIAANKYYKEFANLNII